MTIHHIGYLVKKMEVAIEEFEFLGYKVEGSLVFDESRMVSIIFMKNGDYTVELISPQGKESPIYPLLAKYKNTSYHICYECNDINVAINNLMKQQYILIIDPAQAPAIENRKVAFMMKATIGMIELVEL